MNIAPLVFDVDHVAKIRPGLSVTILEKKVPQNYPQIFHIFVLKK